MAKVNFLPKKGDFNDLSEATRNKLQKSWDALVSGKIDKIGYRFNIGRSNPDKEQNPMADAIIYPQLFKVPEAVYDFRDESGHTRVAMIKKYSEKDPETNTYHKIGIPRDNQGLFWIDVKTDVLAMDKFAWLEMHPHNPSGINPMKSGQELISRIDVIADAKRNVTKYTKLGNAIFAVDAMTEGDIRDFACSQDWDESLDIELLREQVLTMAHEATDAFIEIVDKKDTKRHAIVKRAEAFGIINFNPSTKMWSWGHDNKQFAQLNFNDENKIAALVDWFDTHKNGQAVFEQIKSFVESANKNKK